MDFNKGTNITEINNTVIKIKEAAKKNFTPEILREIIRFIDATSLSCTDSDTSIEAFTRNILTMKQRGLPNVASICVSPRFVETVALTLGDKEIAIAAVGGGFPMSQTFIEVKMLECSMAVENGADEIDIVMNIGDFLAGDYDAVRSELELLRSEIADDAIIKVIIETGELKEPALIRRAAILAMEAGANFVKTSTGKTSVGATIEAVVVICEAIANFNASTGIATGFKVAGGVRSAEDAVLYYTAVKEILGAEWLTPEKFRIGASSLIGEIEKNINTK